MNVTILGAGGMGSAMAARLTETGHRVTVWDRDPARAADLVDRAADLVDRAADVADHGVAAAADIAAAVADASVVITMVTNGEAAQAVAEPMLPAMRSEAIWVQASTVGGTWADRLRALAEANAKVMLDAPVSGSTGPARSGKLGWLLAGPPDAIDAARPVLDALGDRVVVVGLRQEASRLKLVVNTWMTEVTVAMADALAACDRLGIPQQSLLDVVGIGPLAMPYALQKAQLMGDHDYTPGFPIELALKDIQLAEQADDVPPPLVQAVEERLRRAVDAGHGRDDVAAVGTVD
jgi:3-hydroxyisobutyrate dehydrogenase